MLKEIPGKVMGIAISNIQNLLMGTVSKLMRWSEIKSCRLNGVNVQYTFLVLWKWLKISFSDYAFMCFLGYKTNYLIFHNIALSNHPGQIIGYLQHRATFKTRSSIYSWMTELVQQSYYIIHNLIILYSPYVIYMYIILCTFYPISE